MTNSSPYPFSPYSNPYSFLQGRVKAEVILKNAVGFCNTTSVTTLSAFYKFIHFILFFGKKQSFGKGIIFPHFNHMMMSNDWWLELGNSAELIKNDIDKTVSYIFITRITIICLNVQYKQHIELRCIRIKWTENIILHIQWDSKYSFLTTL